MAFPIPVGRMKSADPLNVDHEPGATSRPEAYPSHIRELVPQPAALRIEDADQIRAIFATLSTAHAMGAVRVVHADKGANDNLASPAVAKLALGPRLLVSAEFWDNARQRPWLVELQGLYSLVRFQLEPDARLEGGRFLLPAELECVYRRSERRVSAPPSAKIRILRAQTPETWLERPLRDIGFRGLQFVTHPGDLFYPGERFCAAEVTWKHGPRIPLTAEVRHVSLSDLPNEGLCGVSVDADTGAQAEIWQQEISSLLHPDTTLASPAIAGQLWELYDVSGYFGLDGRKSSDFERCKLAFEISREKLARAPHLGCCVVREHRRRAEATISLLRCWSGAWLAYQGARRHDNSPLGLSGNSVLRDTFLHAYETCLLYTSPSPRDRTRSRMPSSA